MNPPNRPCSLAQHPQHALPAGTEQGTLLSTQLVSLHSLLLSQRSREPFCEGIWFWGLDTFHAWLWYKSLKRDQALRRHIINTGHHDTTLSLCLFTLLQLPLHFLYLIILFFLSHCFSLFHSLN